MAEDKKSEKKNDGPEWGGFKGTIVKGSLKEVDDKLEAVGKTAEGKEHVVIAYPHQKNGAEALRAAHESGKETVVRGPMLGSSKKGTFHFGAAIVRDADAPKAEKAPKPELTAEEKAARSEAAAQRREEADKTRVPVVVGSADVDGSIEVDGETVTVTDLGTAWKLEDEAAVEALAKRFPQVEGLKVGDEVQFAKFAVPEPEADMSPGM